MVPVCDATEPGGVLSCSSKTLQDVGSLSDELNATFFSALEHIKFHQDHSSPSRSQCGFGDEFGSTYWRPNQKALSSDEVIIL